MAFRKKSVFLAPAWPVFALGRAIERGSGPRAIYLPDYPFPRRRTPPFGPILWRVGLESVVPVSHH